MAGPNLDDLRRIFREEYDDLVRLLVELEGLVRRADTHERVSEHADELRRILHTLKGASRAAGFADIETEAHRLEEQLVPWRAAPPDQAGVAAAIRAALDAFGALGATLGVHEVAAESVKAPVAGGLTHDDDAEDGHGALARETLRVDARALESVLAATEDLVLEMARGRGERTAEMIPGLSSDLMRELEQARRILASSTTLAAGAAGSELARRVDRAIGTARTLAASSESLVASHRHAWRGASSKASTLATSARAVRQERFDVLVIPAAQAVREAATLAGVEARVHFVESSVRFDRRLRDDLRDVLLHLARNAVAHGIEPASERRAKGKPSEGTVEIVAEDADGELRIEVRDDGRGIDAEAVAERARAVGFRGPALDAIFAHGLTTATEATPLAGRGVGLDVVRQRMLALHGRIEVMTVPGVGTTFRLSLAPDLSLARALLARAGAYVVAIRLSAVDRIVRVSRSALEDVGGRAHVLDGGVLVPLASLAGELAGTKGGPLPPGDSLLAVMTGAGERRVALAVDDLIDEREIAIRPVRGRFRSVLFVSGTTVLEGGAPVWVLDVRALAAHARASADAGNVVRAAAKRVLVVDDSATTRELERTLLRSAGFEVEAVANGELAWNALQGATPFDVVVSDVEMPVLDGFGLLGRIRATARTASLPVILVTALEDPADKQRALDMGASAYIVKSSFDEEQLLDAIAHLT